MCAVAIVLDVGTWEPLLHLQVGEGDVVANVRQFEDVCVLAACLPLHVLCGNGGRHFLAADVGGYGVSALLIGYVGKGRNVVPLLIEGGVFEDVYSVRSFLVGYCEDDIACGIGCARASSLPSPQSDVLPLASL